MDDGALSELARVAPTRADHRPDRLAPAARDSGTVNHTLPEDVEAGPGETGPLWVWCACIFLTALAARVGLGLALGAFQRAPSGETFWVAHSIATGSGFANPGFFPSGPTVHVPPVYPYLLAPLIGLLPADVFKVTVTALNLIVASGVWGGLPLAAVRLGLTRTTGILAGALGALAPINHWVELNGYRESTLSGFVLMALVAVTFARRRTMTRAASALLGLGWGSMVLLQPATVPVFAVVLGALTVCSPDPRQGIRIVVPMIAVFALTLTPWTIRNYHVMGGFVFVRGNLGLELSVSNNDGALPTHHNVLQNPQARHPHVSRQEFARRLEMGELQYDRARLADAVEWMGGHPRQFASLTAQRVRLFWVPQRSHSILALAQWGLAIFAAVGLLVLRRHPAGWLLAAIWSTYPLLYYLVQTDPRYRYPIEWSIFLAAAAGASPLLERVNRWRSAPSAGGDEEA